MLCYNEKLRFIFYRNVLMSKVKVCNVVLYKTHSFVLSHMKMSHSFFLWFCENLVVLALSTIAPSHIAYAPSCPSISRIILALKQKSLNKNRTLGTVRARS